MKKREGGEGGRGGLKSTRRRWVDPLPTPPICVWRTPRGRRRKKKTSEMVKRERRWEHLVCVWESKRERYGEPNFTMATTIHVPSPSLPSFPFLTPFYASRLLLWFEKLRGNRRKKERKQRLIVFQIETMGHTHKEEEKGDVKTKLKGGKAPYFSFFIFVFSWVSFSLWG